MFRNSRSAFLAALLLALGLMLPASAVAETPCTDGYMRCLNDSSEKSGFFLVLADIECGARLVRCFMDVVVPAN